MGEVVLGSAQNGGQVSSTLEEARDKEPNCPQGDNGDPDREESAEDDTRKQMPVEETDGQFHAACPCYADQDQCEVELMPSMIC